MVRGPLVLGPHAPLHRERHRDGHYIWILSRGKPLAWNPDGSPSRIIGTDTDITKIKQVEAQLAVDERDGAGGIRYIRIGIRDAHHEQFAQALRV